MAGGGGYADAVDAKESSELLQSLLLAEFALFALLSVMKKLLCNKSSFWCKYKTVVLWLLSVDAATVLLLITISIAGFDMEHGWLAVLQELAIIGLVVVTVVVGFFSTLKENTTVMKVYQALLLLRLFYLIAQIPIWYFMDTEFNKMEMFIMKVCLMPYIFLVLFYHTMANELRKEIDKANKGKKKEEPKQPTVSPEEGVQLIEADAAKPGTAEPAATNGQPNV